MATYAIGDVQGCYDELQALLAKIDFNQSSDTLWFTGDLVNRGPKSLEVLRFVSQLPNVICVLGNHDLTLLALAYTSLSLKHHTLDDVLQVPDRDVLLDWLRNLPLLYQSEKFNCVMVHAGISPQWSISEAQKYANEVEHLLRRDTYKDLLKNMYGNEPNRWDPKLEGWDRYRFIINALTRLRFCDEDGDIDLSYKGNVADAPPHLIPWFEFPLRNNTKNTKIIFGHWAALEGRTNVSHVEALDTGCFWGGCLTALRLEDGVKFSVSCKK